MGPGSTLFPTTGMPVCRPADGRLGGEVINDHTLSILNAKYSVLDYWQANPTVPHQAEVAQ